MLIPKTLKRLSDFGIVGRGVLNSCAGRASIVSRCWRYQRERFPLLGHGPLIAAFSVSAVSYSALLRGATPLPAAAAAAFVTALLLFLQLRIADEFKDREDDARFRPYLPVPRGLVLLRELACVGALAAIMQVAVAVLLDPRLLALLLLVWAYLALMSVEFLAKQWLTARPLHYMWTHMLIMPLIDLYATACDWLVAGLPLTRPPPGLAWFLLVSLMNGFVVEIGRKIRAPGDEEIGVTTYSAAWGRPRAVSAWLLAVAVTAALATMAAHMIRFAIPLAALLLVLLALAVWVAWRFLARPTRGRAKAIEMVAGLWTLLMYLGLGVMPLLVRAVHDELGVAE